MTLVTRKAPDFKAQSVLGDNTFKEISLSEYRGKYVLLFFYPLDFTFVCPTEIIAFNNKLEEFKKRNAEVLGVSVDSHFTHLAWKNTPVNQGGIGNIQYPLISDLNKSISESYGVLTQDGTVALRGLFLIDKEGIVHHALVNNDALGRSTDEALRLLDALISFEEKGHVCPANWQKGDESVKPTSEGIANYLSKKS